MPERKKQPEHLVLGGLGEDAAATFLRGLRMKVLERNWRPGLEAGAGQGGAALELDIVADDNGTLVFVEVKSRRLKAASVFSPLDNFSPAKRARLRNAARLYLERRAAWERSCRFDLVCVVFREGGEPEIEYFQDVIQTGEVF